MLSHSPGADAIAFGHAPSLGEAALSAPAVALLAALLLLGIAHGIYWLAALYQIERTRRVLPTARAGIALAREREPVGHVCVIVPAHNEAHAIASLVRSVLAQSHAHITLVLALDRCTDNTAQVARDAAKGDPRLVLHEIAHCPPDWAGKVHAIWSAATTTEAARSADFLLFADADTTFDPECVRATLALLDRRELGMLSLLSTLTHDRWFEKVAQVAAGSELLRQFPLVRSNLRSGRRAFANGQFMLFRAETYRALGGHEAVRDELLEDMAFARLMAQRAKTEPAMAQGVLLADTMIHCRMYDSFAAFKKGWKRIYVESLNRRTSRLFAYGWRLRLFGALISIASFLTTLVLTSLVLVTQVLVQTEASAAIESSAARPQADPLLLATLLTNALASAAFLLATARMHATSHAPLRWSVSYPVGAWIVGGVLIEGARDLRRGTPTEWAGKSYVRPPR
ncbi:MAG: glycosyltransferase [Planctomycetota bacterium]|nr:glycosyltransferase [Planctomycetota bacterium]